MTRELNNPSNQHLDDQYTSEDADQFARLIESCDQQSTIAISVDKNQHDRSARDFIYSTNDDAEFKKLRNGLGKRQSDGPESTKNTQHYAKAQTIDGYTHTDQAQFSSLMSFGENSYRTTTSEKPVKIDDRKFSYSEQDQLCFEQLTPRTEKEEVDQNIRSTTEDLFLGSDDRDVGVIKIIEYDKIKAEKVKKEDRPNENVKIRFFD